MSLVTLREILKGTRKNHYAVGAFNFNGYEDVQGIIQGAAEKNAPVIVMASTTVVKYFGLRPLVYMVKAMAEDVRIPVCLHLDHAVSYDLIADAVKYGFTSVMIDASAKNYETNIKESGAVVDFARKHGCSVEAELGKLGGREDNIEGNVSAFTDPDDVPRFVKETGIDALAVAIGTAHGFYKEEPKLDFDRLEKIISLTECPLVLHGGTGVPAADFKKCVALGMSKINVGTELKATFTNTIRESIKNVSESEIDPKKYVGPVKTACAEVVKNKIDIFGCADKA
jgi:ketose-bisphosphate aldolase